MQKKTSVLEIFNDYDTKESNGILPYKAECHCWKGHSTLTPLGKQDLLLLVTILLPLVKSWCRGQFYFTLLDTLAFLSP